MMLGIIFTDILALLNNRCYNDLNKSNNKYWIPKIDKKWHKTKPNAKEQRLYLLFFILKSQWGLQHGANAHTPLQVQDGP